MAAKCSWHRFGDAAPLLRGMKVPGHHRVICWTHTTRLHVFSACGPHPQHEEFGSEQGKMLGSLQESLVVIGRAPWMAAGDWNMEPLEFAIQWRGVASTIGCRLAPPGYGRRGP